MLNLDKNKKYILACSFGPDSMALFYMLLAEGYKFVVCNIDYNYRPESKRETDSIRDVCRQKNIEFYTKSVLFSTIFHNFEDWARKIRYDFFKEIGRKIGVYDVLVAHQRDDLIETYFMQKERHNLVSFYGLNESYKSEEFVIHRPLLNYTKKDLISYCEKHGYEYSIDPTNFDQTLRRNYYRHSVLPTLSEVETAKILEEIKQKNIHMKEEDTLIETIYDYDKFHIKDLKNRNIEFIQKCIIYLLNQNNLYLTVTHGTASDLKKCIDENSSWKWILSDELYVDLDNEFLSFIDKKIEYNLHINNSLISINTNSNDYENLKKVGILTIKPAKLGYFYKILNYEKKINRLFIDRKMPHFIRNYWPAIFDENGNIVYIPRYRKDYKINKDSLMNFDVFKFYKAIKK